jgi:hypothetical protein
MNILDKRVLHGPGTCNRCHLIKPLAMVGLPGASEDPETGELTGGTMYFDPLDERRQGYCYDCAPPNSAVSYK